LWCSGHVEGAHSGAVTSDGEDDPARPAQTGRSSFDGLNRSTEWWQTWWRDEFGNGGARRTNWSSSSSRWRWRQAEGRKWRGALVLIRRREGSREPSGRPALASQREGEQLRGSMRASGDDQ
jgi:hypothetical protein